MKNSVTNVQRINAKATNAKNELTNVSRNIMYYIRHLNALAKKGEFSNGIDIREFGKECQAVHGQKDLYHASVLFDKKYFVYDSHGKICRISSSKNCPVFGYDVVDITPDGWQYLRPVSLSDKVVLNAFIVVVRGKAKELDKVSREKAKAEKAKEKAYSKELKTLQNEYKHGNITGATFRAEWAKLDTRFEK